MTSLIQFHQRVWAPLNQLLELMQSPTLLLARAYVAYVFFASGLTKIMDWGTTLALFTGEYKVPFLSPAAFQQHVLWGVMLATVAIFGAGTLSIERWVAPRLFRAA